MALSTEESARLTRLQAAYDQIISGANPTMIQEGASRTQFGEGDVTTLKAEIDALQAKAASPTSSRRGAVSFRVG